MVQIVETEKINYNFENDFIYNHFDILYRDHTACIMIKTENTTYYIPFYMDGSTAYLGVWCYKIPEAVFSQLIGYVFKRHCKIKKVYIQNSPSLITKRIALKSDLKQRTHWKVIIPSFPENLDERLSSKKRYNIKREKRIAQQELGDYTILEYTDKTVPANIVEAYFRYKQQTYGIDYHMLPEAYLEQYHVSNIYTLSFSGEIGSIVFSCEQGEHVYLENLTYNPEYKKYSLGAILYDEYLKILCQKRKASLYLGWGNQVYKTLYGAVEDTVYTGTIYRNRFTFLKNGGARRFLHKCKSKLKQIISFNKPAAMI